MRLDEINKRMPDSPGVYLMKGSGGGILYIGKAANLRRRVASYFSRPHDSRIQKLVSEIRNVDCKKTDSALEALILEAKLIKRYSPPYNVREKDDKSFLYVEITKEKFPRLFLVRGKTKAGGNRFGPFTAASSIREALRIVRKIFPFSIHPSEKMSKFNRACFDYEIGLCPGTCIGAVERKEYLKNIGNIKLLFQGKKERILKELKKEMNKASARLDFEKAAKLRGRIFALEHVQDVALIKSEESGTESKARIEGYDISNISGTSAVGAMVVFQGARPNKKEYRLFKIRTIQKSDDVGMLKETLRRRFNHAEWPLPNALLIDGGRGQVNAATQILDEFGLNLPVVGIAKGAKRKKNEFIGAVPKGLEAKTLIRVRNEAHRFAQNYHRYLRSKNSFGV